MSLHKESCFVLRRQNTIAESDFLLNRKNCEKLGRAKKLISNAGIIKKVY